MTRALELRPDREDLQKIKGQLEEREERKEADAYHNRGLSHADSGDHDAAITDNTAAIRLNPEHALAYYGRGVSHEQMGNRAESEADYHRAKELGYEP